MTTQLTFGFYFTRILTGGDFVTWDTLHGKPEKPSHRLARMTYVESRRVGYSVPFADFGRFLLPV